MGIKYGRGVSEQSQGEYLWEKKHLQIEKKKIEKQQQKIEQLLELSKAEEEAGYDLFTPRSVKPESERK